MLNTYKINKNIYIICVLFYILIFIILLLLVRLINIKKDLINLYIYKSNIHGDGLYTNKKINKNNYISLLINSNKIITYFGTKINHSYTPNTILHHTENGWHIVALKNINKNTELTVDYNDTPDFIKKPEPKWK